MNTRLMNNVSLSEQLTNAKVHIQALETRQIGNEKKNNVSAQQKNNLLSQALWEVSQLRQQLNQEKREKEQLATLLSKNEQRWQLALENSGSGAWDWAVETNEIFFSSTCKEMLGYNEFNAPQSLKEWSSLVHPEDLAQANASLKRHFANQENSYTAEKRVKCQDGSYKWILERGRVISRNSAGKPVRMVGTFTDISKQKAVEAELISAKEAAEATAKFKTEFLAHMSHEIRTPVNAIIGLLELLMNTPLSKEQHDFVKTIHNSSNLLLKLINSILDLSKYESGQFELEENPINLDELMGEVFEMVAIKAAEKGLNLAYEINKNVPQAVLGDVTRLRQVLLNLVSNAVKFTHKGQVQISVCCEKLAKGQFKTLFAVKDTGIGLAKNETEKIFQAFQQASAETTRQYGGTGLGLSICKKLVAAMGGDIWVESEPGQGSTFNFTIITKAAPVATPAYLQDIQPQLKGKKMLVIEANKTNEQLLVKLAHGWHMKSETASSVEEVYARLSGKRDFDVVIINTKVNDSNGLPLYQELQTNKLSKHLPIILATCVGEKVNIEDGKARIMDVITLPIKPSQVYNSLLKVLKGEAKEEGKTKILSLVEDKAYRTLSILLAEDNATNQKVMLQMLKRMGHTIDIATNGNEALEAMQYRKYDVVLMDIHMPEMDGLTATREICKNWAPENRPKIIALTASAIREEQEECLQSGADSFISKPVHFLELVKELERVTAESDKRDDKRPKLELASKTRVHPLTAIDRDMMKRLKELEEDGDGFEVKQEVEKFLSFSKKQIAALEVAVKEEQKQTIRELAHGLSGCSGVIGARGMMILSEQVELAVVGQQFSQLPSLVKGLAEAYEVAEVGLRREVA